MLNNKSNPSRQKIDYNFKKNHITRVCPRGQVMGIIIVN